MSLFFDAFEDYIIKNRAVIDDGEGGYNVEWSNGATIKAYLSLGNSSEIRQAEAQELRQVYTATFPKNTPIVYGDYIERADTGEIYRITADPKDNETPTKARFQSSYATAIKTELPQ